MSNLLQIGPRQMEAAQKAIRRDNTPIVMNAEQVGREEYKEYDPGSHDFRWNADYSEVIVIPLRYWSDATYAAYQSEDGFDADDQEIGEPIAIVIKEAPLDLNEVLARDSLRFFIMPFTFRSSITIVWFSRLSLVVSL